MDNFIILVWSFPLFHEFCQNVYFKPDTNQIKFNPLSFNICLNFSSLSAPNSLGKAFCWDKRGSPPWVSGGSQVEPCHDPHHWFQGTHSKTKAGITISILIEVDVAFDIRDKDKNRYIREDSWIKITLHLKMFLKNIVSFSCVCST